MKNYLTLVVGSGYTVYSYEINKEDFTMSIKFTVRSMNSYRRGDSIVHLIEKEGVRLYSFVTNEYCVIETGDGETVDVLFNPDFSMKTQYHNFGYTYIKGIDLEELLNISYIDPDWYEYHL